MAPGEFAHRQIHIAVRRSIVNFPVEIGGVAKRCNTPKIRGISAFRFRFIGLFTVGEGLDPPSECQKSGRHSEPVRTLAWESP